MDLNMSKATTKTLNSFPLDKINLRIEALNKINKDVVKVLDCFHGYGKIWHEIQKRTDKKIELFGIEIDKEKKSNFNVVYGDNKKIIDLQAKLKHQKGVLIFSILYFVPSCGLSRKSDRRSISIKTQSVSRPTIDCFPDSRSGQFHLK